MNSKKNQMSYQKLLVNDDNGFDQIEASQGNENVEQPINPGYNRQSEGDFGRDPYIEDKEINKQQSRHESITMDNLQMAQKIDLNLQTVRSMGETSDDALIDQQSSGQQSKGFFRKGAKQLQKSSFQRNDQKISVNQMKFEFQNNWRDSKRESKKQQNTEEVKTPPKSVPESMVYSQNSSSVKKNNYIIQVNQVTENNTIIENEEDQEGRAKGERFNQIIEMGYEAQFKNSMNKIKQGSIKNQHGTQSAVQQKPKQRREPDDSILPDANVSRFNDDPTISLRNDSFNISPNAVPNKHKPTEGHLGVPDLAKSQGPANQVGVISNSSSFVLINSGEAENNQFSHQTQNLNRSNTNYHSSLNKQILKEQEPYQVQMQHSVGSINQRVLPEEYDDHGVIEQTNSLKAENDKMTLQQQIKMSLRNSRHNNEAGDNINFYRNEQGIPKQYPQIQKQKDSDKGPTVIERQHIDLSSSSSDIDKSYGRIGSSHDRNFGLAVDDEAASQKMNKASPLTQMPDIMKSSTNTHKQKAISPQSFPYQKKASIRSIMSGPTYMSDDIFNSLQIDEQIANHESYLEHLKQLKREQQLKHDELISFMEENLYPEKAQKPAISGRNPGSIKVYTGPSPGQNLKNEPHSNLLVPPQPIANQSVDQAYHLNAGPYIGASAMQEKFLVNNIISYRAKGDVCDSPEERHSEPGMQGEHFNQQSNSKYRNTIQIDQPYLSQVTRSFQPNAYNARKSKMDLIKLEKKQKTFNENMIRKFNMKMYEQIIADLMAYNKGLKLAEGEEEKQEQKAQVFGTFLYQTTGFDKDLMGEYFGQKKVFNQKVLTHFLRNFQFRRLTIESCWRLIIRKTGLPKEGQQITRMIDNFAMVYIEQNKGVNKISHWVEDTVWTMSVKLLDLNTNLHNPNVKPMLRYTKETFIQQCVQLLQNAFTHDQLADMYDQILHQPFEHKVNLNEKHFKRINEMVYSLVQHDVQQIASQGTSSNRKNQVWRQQSQKGINTIMKKYNLNEIFKVQGTKFTKFGRHGKPKIRVVYLSEDETQILWKAANSSEKARSMAVSELETVIVGSDQTQVMRKHKELIPPHFDNCCLSIIGKNRTLDLMHCENQEIAKLWESKIRQLIEKESKSYQKLIKQSPDSPDQLSKSELDMFVKDQAQPAVEYIWKVEILNNWQKYWSISERQINRNQELIFPQSELKKDILEVVNSKGGLMPSTIVSEEKSKRPTLNANAANQQNLRPIAFDSHQQRESNILFCGSTRNSFSQLESNQVSSMDKFITFFNKKEETLMIDQLWYRGLPNIARYCLWPLLIGNSLSLTKLTYDQLNVQVQIIKNKMNYFAQPGMSIVGSSHQISFPNVQQKQPLRSHLSSIVSQQEQEDTTEQISPAIEKGPNYLMLQKIELDEPQSATELSQANIVVDSFSKGLSAQFQKIEKKVDKLASNWENANIIGEAAGVPANIFRKVMENVLCTFLIYKASVNGLQGIAILMDFQNKACNDFEMASFVSGYEKILAPLVLVHMRDKPNFSPEAVENITHSVFICFTNLVVPAKSNAGSIHFLSHFLTDELSQIEWRMDFFDKLFATVLPQLHSQFKGINLKNEFFLHGWIIAMFSNVQGLEGIEFVLRIWDLYLLHGESILYCIALVILKSQIHKLHNAPMKNWLDFFSKIKKLEMPKHCHVHPVQLEMHQEGIRMVDQGYIANPDSEMIIPLVREALSIFIQHDVYNVFQVQEMQQVIAEQKNEVFTKLYLDME